LPTLFDPTRTEKYTIVINKLNELIQIINNIQEDIIDIERRLDIAMCTSRI